MPIKLKKIPRKLTLDLSLRIKRLNPIKTKRMQSHCIKLTISTPLRCEIIAITTGKRQRIKIDKLISI